MAIFDGLIGQEGARRMLMSGFESGALPQALVFAGPDGVGRKTVARMLAMAIHNQNQSAFLADTFWFGINYADKVARNVSGSIKETADDMVHFLQMSPLVSNKKVAIVENAEMLSEEAQSALLKTLEEPRADSLIILIVEDEHSLLPTILSRVQVVKFVLLTDAQVREGVGERVTDEIINFAGGSLGRAMELFEDFELLEETRKSYEFWQKSASLDLEERFSWSEKMKERDTAVGFLKTGLKVVWKEITDTGDMRSVNQAEAINLALAKIQQNANVRMALDSLMLVI